MQYRNRARASLHVFQNNPSEILFNGLLPRNELKKISCYLKLSVA